jgi:O-antigen/teichoic acid export membrane protein
MGAEALKAMDAPLPAVTLENLAIPLTLLGTCLFFWLGDLALTPAALVLAGVGGVTLGALLVRVAVRRRLDTRLQAPGKCETPAERRERRALWLGGVLAIAFLQLPFLVLPAFSDTATIGVFAVAYKLINVVTTLLLLLGSVFGPAFARAAADGDRERLGTLLRRTQWLSVSLYGPAALFLLATTPLLGDLFHVPAAALRQFILLLVLGQAVNAITGLAGVLLCLTGAARAEWRISLAALCLAVLSVLPVGQAFGAPGIAAWFSVVIALKNLASWAVARRHISHGGLPS